MPYTARKVGDQYCVYKKDTGKKVGCTDGTKEALKKYMGALHSNESVRESLKTMIRKEVLKALNVSQQIK
jgi:hypothetical protein